MIDAYSLINEMSDAEIDALIAEIKEVSGRKKQDKYNALLDSFRATLNALAETYPEELAFEGYDEDYSWGLLRRKFDCTSHILYELRED